MRMMMRQWWWHEDAYDDNDDTYDDINDKYDDNDGNEDDLCSWDDEKEENSGRVHRFLICLHQGQCPDDYDDDPSPPEFAPGQLS